MQTYGCGIGFLLLSETLDQLGERRKGLQLHSSLLDLEARIFT